MTREGIRFCQWSCSFGVSNNTMLLGRDLAWAWIVLTAMLFLSRSMFEGILYEYSNASMYFMQWIPTPQDVQGSRPTGVCAFYYFDVDRGVSVLCRFPYVSSSAPGIGKTHCEHILCTAVTMRAFRACIMMPCERPRELARCLVPRTPEGSRHT